MKKYTRLAQWIGAIAIVSIALTGCDPNFVQTQDELAKNSATADRVYDQASQVVDKNSLVEHTGKYLVADKPFEIKEEVVLPPVFNQKIIYASASQETFPDILSDLYAQTGIKFKFTPDAIAYMSGDSNTSSLAGAGVTAESDSGEEVVVGSGEVATSVAVLKSVKMNLQYEGTFKKLLERFASSFNIYWEYIPEETTVNFFRTQTKVLALDLLPGETTFSNQFSSSSELGGSSTSSEGGSGNLNSGAVMDVNYKQLENNAWKDTVATVTNMISSEGKVTPNPRSGYITVTDIPDRLATIESFINKINDKARRKIAVKVDVFDVELDAKTDYGIDWGAVIDAWGGKITLDPLAEADSPLANNVTDSFKFNYVGSGFFDAADLIFRALSRQANTSKVTGTTVYTVNGEPAPVQVVTRSDYIKEVTFSAISDQSSTTEVSVTPGTVVSGFFMVVTPTILSDNQILLNLSISLSTADTTTDTQTVCPADNQNADTCPKIALPKVKSKNFMESVTLNPGQTVIFSGFQDIENKVGVESLAAPQFWALAGAKATNTIKTTTVTVITPYVVGR